MPQGASSALDSLVLIKSKEKSEIIQGFDYPLLDASTFDYLGFTSDQDIKDRCIEVLGEYGLGSVDRAAFTGRSTCTLA